MNPDHSNGWVRTGQDGAVLTVTLDRPDRLNSQTPKTWTALADIGRSLPDDVRVVVVRGEGRAFSAGLDRSLFDPEPGTEDGLGDIGRLPEEQAQERIRAFQAGFRWLRSPGIVSVAAVQGHAIGAGAQLALACDLRVFTEDAALRLPEVTLGLVPDLTGTSTLVELVGKSAVGVIERHAALQRLLPAIDYLLHLWMPGARGGEISGAVWAALDRLAGFARQWETLVHRIRDQLSAGALAALAAAGPR